jgi:hypothetical protein
MPRAECIVADVQYFRRQIYVESVKILKTDQTLGYNEPGYGDLSAILDAFPLVTKITSARGFKLTTPPRYLVDAPQSSNTATLHLSLNLMPGRQTHRLGLTPAPKLRAFACVVAYAVKIGVDCQIDWDLSCWGRRIIPGPKPCLPAWGDRRTTDRQITAYPPYCTMYNRIISSMVIELNIDLDTLSQHLEQRRQLGYEGIPVWTIRTDSLSGLPRFLFQNPYITSLTIIKIQPLPITVGAFLCLDWSVFRRNARDPPCLRHLHVVIDFSKPCVADIEDRIEEITKHTVSLPPVFTLDTITIELEPEQVGPKAIESLPGFSQIAKVLVYLGGDHFELKIKPSDGNIQDPTGSYLRSQLVKEVKRRQDKEKRRREK